MKKIILGAIISSIWLAGCSSNEPDVKTNESQPTTEETTQKSTTTESSVNPLKVTNGPLQKVGEFTEDEDYIVTLLNISEESPTVRMDDLEISVENSKILEYSGEGQVSGMLSYWTDKKEYPVNVLQVSYKINNTGSEVARLSGVNSIVLDSGKQFGPFISTSNFMDSIAGDSVQPHAFIEAHVAVVLESDQLDSFRINFGPTLDAEGFHLTEVSEDINIKF